MSVRPYFFGVYHWRERLRRVVVSALLLAASVVAVLLLVDAGALLGLYY